MIKIIHLSDLHIGYQDLNNKFSDLVTRMVYHKTPGANYVVVVTGDLVDDATREGSYEEVSTHLNRLMKAGFKVLVAPGNHDYGTGIFAPPDFVGRFKNHFFRETLVSGNKIALS